MSQKQYFCNSTWTWIQFFNTLSPSGPPELHFYHLKAETEKEHLNFNIVTFALWTLWTALIPLYSFLTCSVCTVYDVFHLNYLDHSTQHTNVHLLCWQCGLPESFHEQSARPTCRQMMRRGRSPGREYKCGHRTYELQQPEPWWESKGRCGRLLGCKDLPTPTIKQRPSHSEFKMLIQ